MKTSSRTSNIIAHILVFGTGKIFHGQSTFPYNVQNTKFNTLKLLGMITEG